MKKFTRKLAILLSAVLVVSCLAGCGKKQTNKETSESTKAQETTVAGEESTTAGTETAKQETTTAGTETTQPQETTVAQQEETTQQVEIPADGNYLMAAVSVYYNDSSSSYYTYETGTPVIITGDGQYTATFDCATDLSDAAKSAGVKELKNLTAIYLLDVGETQSPIKSANIMFDKVVVNGTELTVTQTAPKSALKKTGIFDTNDPINAWDGSQVAEIDCDTSAHVANFSTVKNPTKISITFTLTDVSFTEKAEAETKPSQGGTENSSENANVNTSVFSNIDFTGVSSLEFISYLGNGLNLGNTMEATITARNPKTTAVSAFETAWGQPITTADMILGMKNCGFDTIRIPVAWTSVMDYKNGDFTIREDFMDRVEEIVNYALDAEMFVIINDHWDYGWWAMFGSNKAEDVTMAWNIYENMWKQIAERFKDYSDMVIFESANEELGNNLNNNANWASSGYLSENEKYSVSNKINQTFVDIVRSSGGNNDDRFLLIAGINTNIGNTCDDRFKMPTDSAKDKLLVSVHFYDPWSYCGDKEGDSTRENDTYAKWGIKGDLTNMEKTLSKLSKFTDQGIGVIIGEWGPLPVYEKDTGKFHALDNSDTYMSYFLDICDKSGYCPVLWTTNSLYIKETCTMLTDSMVDIFTSRSYEKEMAAGDAYLAGVEADMAAIYEAAPEHFEGSNSLYGSNDPVAYIMWNGGAGSYNVGDIYTPDECAATIIPTDVLVEGEGEYTVRLDFPKGNDGLTFGALALNAGEINYPGCILDIKSVVVTDKDGNETKLKLAGLPYTSSDDGICTRVNLINSWVSQIPADARNSQNMVASAKAVILNATDLTGIYSISVTFKLTIK